MADVTKDLPLSKVIVNLNADIQGPDDRSLIELMAKNLVALEERIKELEDKHD